MMKILFKWIVRLIAIILIIISVIVGPVLCVISLGMFTPWNSDGNMDFKLHNYAFKLFESTRL
jgi:uncharacterized membrane protein YjgN (DUF898 family)